MLAQSQLAEKIEKYVANLPFPVAPARLYEPIVYTLETGGKRIRPVLLLAAADVFTDKLEPVLPLAAAVEVFHNFTLLHDDIMDNADVRRGRATVHKKWDASTAILSGDAMVIYAYTLLEQVDKTLLGEIFTRFNRMSIEVCEGQQWDMDFETMDTVTLDQYLEMIRLKTAALIARAMEMGAVLAGADAESCDALYEFGVELGIAFQLQDDYLDTYGTSEILGKTVGGDIMEAKKTFLLINALEKSDSRNRAALLALLHDTELSREDKLAAAREIFDRVGVRDITLQAIGERTSKALGALTKVKGDTTVLRSIAEGLLKRNK